MLDELLGGEELGACTELGEEVDEGEWGDGVEGLVLHHFHMNLYWQQ